MILAPNPTPADLVIHCVVFTVLLGAAATKLRRS